MTKQETLERLCNLVTKVGEAEFGSRHAHDCFCSEQHLPDEYVCIAEEVIDYIEVAVIDKLMGR